MTTRISATIWAAAVIAYDGTDYFGFQLQKNVPTIQGALEQSLQNLVRVPCRIVGAGRTDTGVHARGQVIGTVVPWSHTPADLQRAWNAFLPASIVIRRLCVVPETFHPRFSARSRTYRYRVYQDPYRRGERLVRRDPLHDRFAHFENRFIDMDAMKQAAQYLLGEQDFCTFGQPPQGENTVRTVQQIDIQFVNCDLPALDAHPGRCLVFTIRANAFLRRMARNIVGTLLAVGTGDWQPHDVQSALLARNRNRCAAPAAARGLVLEHVSYPDYPELSR